MTKLSWVEVMVGENGRLNMVRCKIYNVVQCHDKLFIPKFNGLKKKHVNHYKVKFAHL